MRRPWTQVVTFGIGAALTALAWWHPFPVGGLGWVVAALIGPFLMVLMVCELLYPSVSDDGFPLPTRHKGAEKGDAWRMGLEIASVVLPIIHGGIWIYFHWR